MSASTVAVLEAPEEPAGEPVPRRIVARDSLQDRVFAHGVRSVAFVVFLIVGSIGLFLGLQSRPTLQHYGFHFFIESRWLPSQDVVGIKAVLVGTLEVATVALLMAFPLAFLTALFITDWAPAWMRPALIRIIRRSRWSAFDQGRMSLRVD